MEMPYRSSYSIANVIIIDMHKLRFGLVLPVTKSFKIETDLLNRREEQILPSLLSFMKWTVRGKVFLQSIKLKKNISTRN